MSHCARILLLMTHVFTSTIGDTSVVNLVNSKKAIRFIMYLLGHCLRVVRDDGRIRSSPADMLVMGNDPVNVFLVDVDLARNLASLGDNFEWTFQAGSV